MGHLILRKHEDDLIAHGIKLKHKFLYLGKDTELGDYLWGDCDWDRAVDTSDIPDGGIIIFKNIGVITDYDMNY
jgi:hypothetical protein